MKRQILIFTMPLLYYGATIQSAQIAEPTISASSGTASSDMQTKLGTLLITNGTQIDKLAEKYKKQLLSEAFQE
jgi:hypothetical protein